MTGGGIGCGFAVGREGGFGESTEEQWMTDQDKTGFKCWRAENGGGPRGKNEVPTTKNGTERMKRAEKSTPDWRTDEYECKMEIRNWS